MQLSDELRAVLKGEQGEVRKKALETLVKYGEVFGAERLVPITKGHVVMPTGASFLPSYLDMLNSLLLEGLAFRVPTSINPRPFERESPGFIARLIYNRQDEFENIMNKLGIIPCYTCAPYFKDNIPQEGEILGWAESSAVVYANSVAGARTNRNSSMIEICSAVLGLTPEFGLLLDENRKADYLVEVEVDEIDYSLLGFWVGQRVGAQIPYYTGIPVSVSAGDLKDLGAASAASGAVGLFHVENVTPEARRMGRTLLKENHTTLTATEGELRALRDRIKLNGKPNLIIIGCPHLSFEQLAKWAERIDKPVKVETWLVAAPGTVADFSQTDACARLRRNRVKLKTLCSLGFMEAPHLKRLRVLTNSGKLAYYTAAGYGNDDECLKAMYGEE